MTEIDDVVRGVEASRRVAWRSFYEQKGETEKYADQSRFLHYAVLDAMDFLGMIAAAEDVAPEVLSNAALVALVRCKDHLDHLNLSVDNAGLDVLYPLLGDPDEWRGLVTDEAFEVVLDAWAAGGVLR